MAIADPGVEEQIRDEIAMSEAELSRLEPQVDGEVIQQLVRKANDDLMPAKVHSYVPILVVREVRDILHGRYAAA